MNSRVSLKQKYGGVGFQELRIFFSDKVLTSLVCYRSRQSGMMGEIYCTKKRVDQLNSDVGRGWLDWGMRKYECGMVKTGRGKLTYVYT